MAKKANLLAEAKKLGLEVTDKNTVAQIEAARANAAAIVGAVSASDRHHGDGSRGGSWTGMAGIHRGGGAAGSAGWN